MKTIILYATKYGAAREIASRIAAKLSDVSLFDLKKDAIPPLSGFDCVIVGSSVYVGQVRKEAKTFIAQNAAVLREKKTGLFLSGLAPEKERTAAYFTENYPAEVLQSVKAKGFLGGIFDPKKAGFFDKILFKAAAKQSGYVTDIFNDEIDAFIRELMK